MMVSGPISEAENFVGNDFFKVLPRNLTLCKFMGWIDLFTEMGLFEKVTGTQRSISKALEFHFKAF